MSVLTTVCQFVGAAVLACCALAFALAGLAMMRGRSKLRRDVPNAQRHEADERAMLAAFNNPRRSFVRPAGYRMQHSPATYLVWGHDEADAAARLCGRTVDA